MVRRPKAVIILIAVLTLLNMQIVTAKVNSLETSSSKKNAEQKRITVNLLDVDIYDALAVIAEKGRINIVTSPEVEGSVRIRLVDVPWNVALDTILKIYGYGYQRRGDIITVFPLERIEALEEAEAMETAVVTLQYLNAKDVQKALQPQLSSRGRITVVEKRGQRGWEFGEESESEGGMEFAKKKRVTEEPETYSRTLIITDIPSQLEIVRRIIAEIDKEPRQILIQTRIMEVNRDRLKDLGIDWGTGSTVAGRRLHRGQRRRGADLPSAAAPDGG